MKRNEDGTVEFSDGGIRYKLTRDGLGEYFSDDDHWAPRYDLHEDMEDKSFRALLAEAIQLLDGKSDIESRVETLESTVRDPRNFGWNPPGR
jgi:hypothetical protein